MCHGRGICHIRSSVQSLPSRYRRCLCLVDLSSLPESRSPLPMLLKRKADFDRGSAQKLFRTVTGLRTEPPELLAGHIKVCDIQVCEQSRAENHSF